jgi:hypothetical protein
MIPFSAVCSKPGTRAFGSVDPLNRRDEGPDAHHADSVDVTLAGRCISLVTRCLWHAGGTAGENDDALTWRRWLQLGHRGEAVLGDHCLVGKSLEGSRQPGRAVELQFTCLHHRCTRGCRSSDPRFRQAFGASSCPGCPRFTRRLRTQHELMRRSGPILSWTPSALRSSAALLQCAVQGQQVSGPFSARLLPSSASWSLAGGCAGEWSATKA